MIRKTEWIIARSVSSRERHPQYSIGIFCDANHSLALALKAHTSHAEPTGLVEVGHGTVSRSSAFISVCTAAPMAIRHVTTPTPRKNCGQTDIRTTAPLRTQPAALRCRRDSHPATATQPHTLISFALARSGVSRLHAPTPPAQQPAHPSAPSQPERALFG